MNNPLQAEIHDIRIYRTMINSDEIYSASIIGPRFVLTSSEEPVVNPELMLYVPPFFTKDSRPRTHIYQTPVEKVDRTAKTINPFNARLSFNTNISSINLENFTREFVRAEYPRLLYLSESGTPTGAGKGPARIARGISVRNNANGSGFYIDNTGISYTYVAFENAPLTITAMGSESPTHSRLHVKRNLTILPCDNGLFRPNFALLATGTLKPPTREDDPFYNGELLLIPPSSSIGGFHSGLDKFVTDEGSLDLSLINVGDILYIDSEKFMDVPWDSAGVDSLGASAIGANPYFWQDPDIVPDVPFKINNDTLPAVAAATRDGSSNAVVFFDISNLYYGDRLFPGTLKLRGKVGVYKESSTARKKDTLQITLRDNGRGGLYRADSKTRHADWNSVGNVLYDEGLISIVSPHLKDFGELEHDAFFQGERQLHILEIMVPCPAGMVNSSSNPTWRGLLPNDYTSETEKKFVYVTGLNFHDDNFNVISRTNLSQPVTKRESDEFLFRVKIDF